MKVVYHTAVFISTVPRRAIIVEGVGVVALDTVAMVPHSSALIFTTSPPRSASVVEGRLEPQASQRVCLCLSHALAERAKSIST